jgi:hypothetical protein
MVVSKNRRKKSVPEVTPEVREQIESPLVRLMDSMAGTKFMEVLDYQYSEDKIRLALRCHDPRAWSLLTVMLLKTERLQKEWSLHICKQYTLVDVPPDTPDDDGLRFYWNLILRSDSLGAAVERVGSLIEMGATTILSLPRSELKPKPGSKKNGERKVMPGELMEYPLLAPPDRNRPEVGILDMTSKGKRKGAHFIGSGK